MTLFVPFVRNRSKRFFTKRSGPRRVFPTKGLQRGRIWPRGRRLSGSRRARTHHPGATVAGSERTWGAPARAARLDRAAKSCCRATAVLRQESDPGFFGSSLLAASETVFRMVSLPNSPSARCRACTACSLSIPTRDLNVSRESRINPTLPRNVFAFVLVRGGCGRGASALPPRSHCETVSWLRLQAHTL